MCTMKLTVVITTSIITLIGVRRKPMLKISSVPNKGALPKSSHVRLNAVTVGYKPAASLPTAKKYS